MRRALRLLLVLLALLPAAASEAAPPTGLSEKILEQSGLPLLLVEGLRVYHSPSARAEARLYGTAIAAALAWYRAELRWQGEIAVAVLDVTDWQALVSLPYPVPHAQRNAGLVVMPDSIESFPGFGSWGFEAAPLNVALTFHEIGHLIAPQVGLGSGNLWIEELIANLFLAAYVRAERPDLAPILAGVPPRFANPGPFDQLFDLDSFYAGGGLENYAWFQFRLAALAGRMVEGRGFGELMAAMRAAFPAARAGRRATIARTLELLEQVAPGATALVADMAGDGVLPALAPHGCDAGPAPHATTGAEGLLLFDNRGPAPLGYRFAETSARQTAMTMVAPGEVVAVGGRSGALLELASGDCLTIPAGAARFSVAPGG